MKLEFKFSTEIPILVNSFVITSSNVTLIDTVLLLIDLTPDGLSIFTLNVLLLDKLVTSISTGIDSIELITLSSP